MLKTILVGLAITVCLLFIFIKLDPNIKRTGSNSTVLKEGNYLTVSISGEINKSGTYIMGIDDTLGDLIDTAGGTTPNADHKTFNTQIDLKDGVNYYISPISTGADSCVIDQLKKVNINRATKEELMSINGIGATVSSSIITHREQNGLFTYLEQIMDVPGIGNATFEKIKNYITLS